MKASDNVFPKLIASEGAAPATPAAGTVVLYAKTDGLLYSKDDAGAETPLSAPVLGLLTNAADDTAAATAGVAVGSLYRNGSVLMIRVA